MEFPKMLYHPEHTTEQPKFAIVTDSAKESKLLDAGYKRSPDEVCQYGGDAREKFIAKLTAAGILQAATISQFETLLDEYDASEDEGCDGSGTLRKGWDSGFAQDGDPYGIGDEYLTQSPNPDSAFPPTQAQADKINAQFAAEKSNLG